MSPSTSHNNRELIWKTAEGAEKRLLLPIEMIKEDVMDDPERLLSEAGKTNDENGENGENDKISSNGDSAAMVENGKAVNGADN